MRLKGVVGALVISADPAFKLDGRGQIFWREAAIARLVKSDNLYAPRVEVGDSDLLNHDQKARIQDRLNQFIADHVAELLQPIIRLTKLDDLFAQEAAQKTPQTDGGSANASASDAPSETEKADAHGTGGPVYGEALSGQPVLAPTLSGAAKGVLYQLYEGLGTMPRRLLADQIKELSEADKPLLARAGIRMGIENLFLPAMLKPAPIALRVLLYSLYHQNFPVCGPRPRGAFPLAWTRGRAKCRKMAIGWQPAIADWARVSCAWI